MKPVLEKLRHQLVVSVQALDDEPLHGAETMRKVAKAVLEGGAGGLRMNSPADIRATRPETTVPIIGLWKVPYPDSAIYITPTQKEVEAVIRAGADMVAIDATQRRRPAGESLKDMMASLRTRFPSMAFMADISTLSEGLAAQSYGFDCLGTTLSGYTESRKEKKGVDFELVSALARAAAIPVFCEGRITEPRHIKEARERGAWCCVVGSIITRPQYITRYFLENSR